jgi:hypothetical protein
MVPVAGVIEFDRCNDAGIRGENHEVEGKSTHPVKDSVRRRTALEPHHLEELYLSEHDVMGQRLDKPSIENLFRVCE